MHLKVTPKGLFQAFTFAVISCILLIGLPTNGVNAHRLTVTEPAANTTHHSPYAYLDNYRKWHPYSPLKQPAAIAAGPLWSYANNQQFITGGLGCIACFIDNPQNAVDGDTTTASKIVVPLAVGASAGQVLKFPGQYQAGEYIAIDLEIPDKIYTKQLLSAVKIHTLNGGIDNNDAITLDNSLIRLQILGLGLGSTPKFRVIFPATKDFDAVQIDLAALFAEFGALRIYEATAFVPVAISPLTPTVQVGGTANLSAAISRIPGASFRWYTTPAGGTPIFTGTNFITPPLQRHATYYVEATSTADGLNSYVRTAITVGVRGGQGPLWSFADTEESPITGGIACALCSVENPEWAVDGDTTTSSGLILPIGIATSLGQRLKFAGDYKAGDNIALDLELPGQLLNAQLLSGLKVRTFNGNVDNADIVTLNTSLLKLQLLGIGIGNTPKFRVIIPVTKDFNTVQVDLQALVSGLGSLRIYEATAFIPVSVTPATPVVTSGQSAILTPAIDARVSSPTYNWYTTPSGGIPVFTGTGAFTTPALNTNTTYYVEAVGADGRKSYVRTAVTVKVQGGAGALWSYANDQEFKTGGLGCIACLVDQPEKAVDGDTTTASKIVVPLAVGASAGQILKFPGKYKAGESIALDLEIPDKIYTKQLLSAVKIHTLNGGIDNNDAIQLDNALIRLQVLGLGLGSTPKFRVIVPVANDFDAVQVDLAALFAEFGALRIYEATAFVPATITPATPTAQVGGSVNLSAAISRMPGSTFRWYTTPGGGVPVFTGDNFATPPLSRSTTYYVEATSPTDGLISYVRTPISVKVRGGNGPLWSFADTQESPLTGGIACALCYVDNPDLAVDGDTTTASRLVLPVGIAASLGQRLQFAGDYKTGDNIAIDLEVPDQIINAQLLSAIKVRTFNGTADNADVVTLSNSLIKLQVLGIGLGTTPKVRVIIPVTKDFNAVQVDLEALVSGFGTLRIYEASAFIPVTVTPASPSVTSGQPATLTPGIDARVAGASFNWYTSPTGGTPVFTGTGTFTTPALTANTTYYVEAVASSGLKSYVRTPVTVKVQGGVGPLWSHGNDQQFVTGGLGCIGCFVDQPDLAVDGDTTTASKIVVPLAVGASAGQILKFPGLYKAGESIALDLEIPDKIYTKQLLSAIKIHTLNGGVDNNDAIQLDNSLIRLQVLGLGLGSTPKFRVIVPVTKDFDAVQVDLQALFAEFGALRIYEATAFIPVAISPVNPTIPVGNTTSLSAAIGRIPGATFRWYTSPSGGTPVFSGANFTTPVLNRSKTYYVEAISPVDGLISYVRTSVPVKVRGGNGPIWSFADTQESPITSGVACALCYVDNPSLAVDEDTTTASRLVLPVGVAAGVGQKLQFAGDYKAGDYIALDLEIPDQALSAQLLGGIKVRTFNGTVDNGDAIYLNNTAIKLQVLGLGLGTTPKFRAILPVTRDFNAVQIDLEALVTGLGSLRIYEASAFIPVKILPETPLITAGQTAALTASIDARVATPSFNWYSSPTGGTPLFTGNVFTTPALTRNTTYYAEAVSPTTGLNSYVRTPVTVRVGAGPGIIWSFGQDQESPITGGVACLGCAVSDPLNASDGDTTTASTFSVPLGIAGSVGQLIKFPGVYQPGDSIVLFMEAPSANLSGVILPKIQAQTYKNATQGAAVPNNDLVTLNAGVIKLQLLGIGVGGNQKFRVSFPVNAVFDAVRVDLSGLISAAGNVKLYEAAATIPIAVTPSPATTPYRTPVALTPVIRLNNPATPTFTFRWYTTPTGGVPLPGAGAPFTTPALSRNTTYYVEAVDPTGVVSLARTAVPVRVVGGNGPIWSFGIEQKISTGGIACVLCTVNNAPLAADEDSTTASRLITGLSVAGSVGQNIRFPGTYQAGDSIVLILGTKTDPLASLSLLNSIQITTFNNGTSNSDAITINPSLLNLQLLGGDTIKKFRVSIPATKTFDAVQIDLNSLVGVSGSLDIFEAVAMKPVTVTPNPANITAGQTATFTASIANIADIVFNWYETPTGGAPIATGPTFTTPPLYANKTYYAEGISPTDGLTSFQRTAVQVIVTAVNGGTTLACNSPTTSPDAGNGPQGLCVGCFVENALLATDDKVETGSTLHTVLGLLGGYVRQTLVFDAGKGAKAGDSIRIGLGSATGLLDLGVLSGIQISTYNGATPNNDLFTVTSDLLTIKLLMGVQQNAVTFKATKDFDRIEVRFNAGVAALLSALNLYYVKILVPEAQVAVTDVRVCSGQTATLSATGPVGQTYRWYSTMTGGTALFTGANFITPAITANTTYYVEAVSATGCASDTRKPVTITVGLPSVNVNPPSAAVTAGQTPTFNVLNPNPAYRYDWYTQPVGGTPVFVGPQFTIPAVSANITYYVEATDPTSGVGCKSLRTPVPVTLNGGGGPLQPGDIDCGGATSQQSNSGGICVGCYVEKQDSAVDNSTKTASVLHTILGVGSYIEQTLIFPTQGKQGDSVRIGLGFPTSLLDLGLLTSIQVSSANGATANNDMIALNSPLINLSLLNGNTEAVVVFAPGNNFDRVTVRLNGLVSALTALKIYYAQAFAGKPAVEKENVYVCQGGSATLKATGPGTSFRWFTQPTGGTAIATGANYTISNVTANAIYYVEAVSGAGCASGARKAVNVFVGLPIPTVTPTVQTINNGATATFTINNPNTAYEYNWFDAPVGGTEVAHAKTSFTTPPLTASKIYYVEAKDPSTNCTTPTRVAVRVDINMPNDPTPCSFATQQQSPIITGVCLLCGVNDPALAIDANANSASTISAVVGAAGYVGQLLKFDHTYPVGDSITLDLEIPGQLADVQLLGGIRVETYNGATANGDAINVAGGGILSPLVRLTLLNTGNKFRITLPATKEFNGVLVSINGLVTLVTNLKVYFAAVITPRPVVAAPIVSACSGSTATLTATVSDGAIVNWYTDAVGGTPAGTGTTFVTPVLTSSVTYYAEASRFGCASPVRIPVSVQVGGSPVAPTATGKNICAGETVTLLATAPAGVNFAWYSAPTGGTLLAATPAYTTNVLTADTAFYVESDNNGCKSITRTRVPVTVNAAPTGLTVFPMGTAISRGQSAQFTASASGTNIIYKWYNAAGDSVATGAVFNTGALQASTTYAVEASTATGCKAAQRVTVSVTVLGGGNDLPCDAATAQTNGANGICVGCYVENPALAVDSSTQTASTLHVILGLLGGYTQQTLIFPNVSELNDSVQVSLSFPASLADIGLLSGIQIGSYNGAQSNNDFVAINDPLVKVILLSGNQQAMVGFKPKGLFDRIEIRLNSGVASALSAVNINYASRLVRPAAVQGSTICAGERASLQANGPANVKFNWYSQATGGTPIFTGNTFQTPALQSTTTYYVEAVKTSLNCPNPLRVPVVATVTPVPDAPQLDTATITVCAGGTATFNIDNVAVGVTYRWYTTPTAGTPVFEGVSFTTPTLSATAVYYIEASNGQSCANTTRTQVTANVTAQPPVPVVTPTSATICANSNTQLVASSSTAGVVFRWYTAAVGGTAIFEGSNFTTPVLTTTTTYYVEAATGNCASATRAAAVVTVNQTPQAPTVTVVPAGGTVISGQTATLTATSATPGVTFNWYTIAIGGSPVFTGNPFVTPALTSNVTYYVEAVSATGSCPSTRTAVSLSVDPTPNPNCDFANAQTNSTQAICVLCDVLNAANTTDADLTNFSSLSIPLGAGDGGVEQTLIFPQPATQGDSVRITVEFPAQILDAGIRSAIEVSSFNGATANGDAILLDNAAIKVNLLSGSSKYLITFAPGATYDRVRVRLKAGIVSALLRLNIYYATQQVSAPNVSVRNVNICSGTKATLNATATPVAKLEWYDAPVGGNKVGDGTAFETPVLTTTTTYYVQSVRLSNNCANPNRVSVTVNVLPALPAPTAPGATICAGQSAILTATAAGTGVQLRWFDAATGGNLLFTGSTYATNALSADTAFYVEAFNGACGSATRTKVNVTVNSGAPMPVLESNNVTVCQGQTATFRVTSNTTGITYNWYTSLVGGTAVFSGPVFTTPVLNATVVYYVEAVNTASSCTAPTARVMATANVAPTPPDPQPVSTSVRTCAGQDAVLGVLNPQTNLVYEWYDAPTGGTLVSSGPVFTVKAVTTAVDYYLQAVNNSGCASASARVKVSILVDAAPATPTVTATSVAVCSGSGASLSVQNPNAAFTYRWFDAATGGNLLFTGTVYNTAALTANTDFYVEASNGNCGSAVRARVSVTIDQSVPNPVPEATNVTVCTGSAATLKVISATTGIDYKWYTQATGGIAVFTGPQFVTPALTTTTIYYVEAVGTASQCINAGGRVAITATVVPAPVVPVPVAASVRVCAGRDVTLAVQNPQPNVSYQWFDAATGGTLLLTGASVTVPAVTANADYYVQATIGNGGCSSATRAKVSIAVDDAPATPDVAATNVIVCVGGTATFNILNPNPALTYRWYDAPANGNLLSTGTQYTTAALNQTTTFYVEALNENGCSSPARKGATAQVVTTIDAPVATGATICGSRSAVLQVTSPLAGITYNWYTTATGGTPVFSGTNFTTSPLTASITYYLEASSNGGCVSASRTPVQVTVNNVPATPAVASATVPACIGETATLSVQNPDPAVTYRWYDAPTGGTQVAIGATFTTPAVSTNQMYYVEAVNANGCSSAVRTGVSVTVGPPPGNITVTGNALAICPGGTATLTATSATAAAGFRWYSAATGGTLLATGASFTTPALTTTTIYYVEAFTTGGCASSTRTAAEVKVFTALATPVVTVGTTTPNSVTFTWTAVPNAVRYEVSRDNGATYITPSSGASGLSHTITGLSPNQEVSIRVRAVGTNPCETSQLSAAVTGRTANPAGDNVYIPNMFSPNGDGVNDVFTIYGSTILSMEMYVYNQWGQQVAIVKDQRRGWDGTMSGTKQPAGVYVYVVQVRLQNGTTITRKGNVTIIR